ncbi:hypothetical protein BH23BAC1_BH23BAC1_22780 [soil metagenome]
MIIKNAFLAVSFFILLHNCSPTQSSEAEKIAEEPEYYDINDFKLIEKIDAHVHLLEDFDTAFIKQAEEDNFHLLTVNVYAPSWKPIEEQQEFAIRQVQAFPDRLAWATTFSLENFNNEGWVEETISYLKNSFSKGAIAVKVWKNIGFFLKDENGELVMINHPKFDPVLKFLAKNDIPLLGHLGEHRNSWLPLEKMTVKGNRDYAAAHPEEHMYLHPERPSYEEYIEARDQMLEKHPDLKFVGAHLGSLEWSVDELAKRLDRFPNMAVDMAERISHLQFQALTDWQKVHDFFIKYQDRIIYATDLRKSAMDIVNQGITDQEGTRKHAHEVWIRHWKFFNFDEEMNVPKVEGTFKGLKLPKEVVDKIYYKNAAKWYPGIIKSNSNP